MSNATPHTQPGTPSMVSRIKTISDELRGFARLERNLAILLLLTPALLIAVDTEPDIVRGSISAYHDVGEPSAFYVPLTIGAMLFIVNGILRREHVYNTLLGGALLGLIIFDHEGEKLLHMGFAIAFFLGNFIVMMLFSTNKSIKVKLLFGAAIVGAGVLWVVFSLFWAEWVSLGVVATHYFLDSVRWSKYEALEPGQTPKLLPERQASPG